VVRGRVGRCFEVLIGRFGVGWDIAALTNVGSRMQFYYRVH
jgi:hypothetical protein